MEDAPSTAASTAVGGTTSAAPTLSALLGRGQAALAALQDGTLPSASPAFQERVRDALRDLLQCAVAVSRGDVFSANETLEDFSAERLRFVLVPFYLAELTQLLADDRRGAHLLRARAYYNEFLETAHRLTHKIAMRRTLAEAGVPQPRFAAARDLASARAA